MLLEPSCSHSSGGGSLVGLAQVLGFPSSAMPFSLLTLSSPPFYLALPGDPPAFSQHPARHHRRPPSPASRVTSREPATSVWDVKVKLVIGQLLTGNITHDASALTSVSSVNNWVMGLT